MSTTPVCCASVAPRTCWEKAASVRAPVPDHSGREMTASDGLCDVIAPWMAKPAPTTRRAAAAARSRGCPVLRRGDAEAVVLVLGGCP